MDVRIDGLSLHYDDRGAGEPLLFIHGFPLSGAMWEPAVQRLEDGWRCLVPDLRGLGASEASEEAGMAVYADDLVALLDAVGETRPVVVVALSMGGYVAFELLRRHPGRVRALALVDTKATADAPEAARARLEMAERVLREGSGVAADAMAPRLFAPSAPEALRARWRGLMAAAPPRGVAAAQRAMAARPDSAATLAAFPGPVLLVVGAEDAITPPDEARRMLAHAPHARLEVVEGAGHMTPVEQPERFAAIVREWLGGL